MPFNVTTVGNGGQCRRRRSGQGKSTALGWCRVKGEGRRGERTLDNELMSFKSGIRKAVSERWSRRSRPEAVKDGDKVDAKKESQKGRPELKHDDDAVTTNSGGQRRTEEEKRKGRLRHVLTILSSAATDAASAYCSLLNCRKAQH